jgi:hypothetical protein
LKVKHDDIEFPVATNWNLEIETKGLCDESCNSMEAKWGTTPRNIAPCSHCNGLAMPYIYKDKLPLPLDDP